MDEIIFWLLVGGVAAVLSSPIWIETTPPGEDEDDWNWTHDPDLLRARGLPEKADALERAWGIK